ncbi:MAG: hypothetical protein ACKVPJ_10750 [Chitinophagales bacterium]
MNRRNFAKQYCEKFYLINGKRNTILTMLRQFFLLLKILFTRKIKTIHVINEQLMIFFYPIFFFKYTVLDVFDSIFLLWNKSGEKWNLIKRIVYAPVNKILVTDENRRDLMPAFVHHKIIVLENYPIEYEKPVKKNTNPDEVTIFFNGCMSVNRGLYVLQRLVEYGKPIKVIMAGWIIDKETEHLIQYPNVEYRGIVTQDVSLTIAANEADYILCLYAPVNENNINASPNKIYDSIQTQTPVIINSEVNIADFVAGHDLGIVLPSYHFDDTFSLVQSLKERKNTFHFNGNISHSYTWQTIEHKLIGAHKP